MTLGWDEFVEAYANPWPGGWLIDGDQFVTTQQLRDIHEVLTHDPKSSETRLLALNDAIFDEVWSEPRKLELTWCVGVVFPQPNDEDAAEKHQERYERILRGMERGTKAWERATGVNFVHLSEFDDPAGGIGSGSCQPGQNNVHFRVRMGVSNECSGPCAGVTNATPITEFDPDWAGPDNPGGFERELLFGPRAVDSEQEMQITARHELGHVLGFAHEHLAFEQDVCNEFTVWRSLTPPDPKSVMANDTCPGAAKDQPRLSGFDRLGAFYQYSRARRNPLMMGGASLVHDYAYDGSERPGIAWFTPLDNAIQQWTSTAAPGQAIAFTAVERCLDGQAPPCGGSVEISVGLRPSPLFASGTYNDLDLLLLGPGTGLPDFLLSNDGTNYSLAAFSGPDFTIPIIGSFGHEIDDQIIIYQPGPASDSLFDPASGALYPVDYADYAFPIPARFRGFGGGGNDLLWYQPDAQTIEIWEWGHIPEFGFDRQGPIPVESLEFEPDVEYMPLIGDFNGDDRTDLFWYAPGVPTDWLWLSVSNQAAVIFDRFERQVMSEFRPLIGDFNGDGIDDIFWYAGRSETPDALSVIWQFDEGGGHTPRIFSINGDYAPVVGDFDDDGCSDILWHDPADPDHISPLWRCVDGEAFACDTPVEAPADGFPIGTGLYG
ncbi:hypothetical protein DB30_04058 [Enhygromyxa salina]|uniref:FG-GAP repeat protein n=1 Tax=Enhygromyxa salina TaxID=215803 RepID=A0A0C2D0Y7_9BACT|nr:hypothetical protein [Enhygromyxa salina]KIG16896.1 hypothetical protein DB30_04058 [Enhygromyxa salina]